MTTGKAVDGKPYAGNPHVTPSQCYGVTCRFDKKLRLTAIVAVAIISSVAFGETYSWKYVETRTAANDVPPASPNWHSFGDYNNWVVGTTYTGENPDAAVPGADDAMYFGKVGNDYNRKIACFNLGGNSYTVKELLGGESQWITYLMLLTNGTFTVTGSFTNRATHVHLYNGGKFVHGPDCVSVCGSSYVALWHVYDGGEADIGGNINVRVLRMEVESGGVMTFRPKIFAFDGTADKDNGATWLKNSGTLAIPGKLSLTGWSGDKPCVFSIEQNAGILTLGGDISNGQYNHDVFDFILAGGTVNVTNDVKFSNMRTVQMSEDAVVTVNVDAGKTFDLTTMNFGAGTVLTKSGEGTVKFGASVPDVLNIDGGVVEPTVAVQFGTVSFTQGGILHLGLTGVSAKKIQGAANATLTASAAVLSSQKPIFLTEDEDDAAVLAGKLVPPEGYAVIANGGTLTVEKPHAAAEFVWKHDSSASFWSFYDPSNWGVGDAADAGNDNSWIPGENDVINHGFIYNQYYCFNMEGGRRWIKGLGSCMVSANKWAPFRIMVSNGTLGIVSNFTNVHALVTVYDGGRFVLGENCGARMGSGGATSEFTVQSGGECDIGGEVYVDYLKTSVNAGGCLVFHPKTFAYESSGHDSHIRNSGTLELPNGITLGGASQGGRTFTVEQRAGEMVLGGDVKMLDQVDYLDFNLTGGTVRVTADAAFVGCRSVVMTNDAVAEISVDTGKTADFSAMVFREGTALSKTGDGTLKISASVPQSLDVQAGTLAVVGAAAFGEGLALGDGATLHFAAGGSSSGAIPGLDDATVTLDPQSVGYGSAIISSTNAALIASMAEKLAPAIAAADKPKLSLVVEVQAGDPDVRILRLMRVPKGMSFSFR